MTFSLDESTAKSLNQTAERLRMAKSEVVREAIQDYAARAGQLSEKEKQHLLLNFDEHVPAIPGRPADDVDQEIEELRRARRAGGRAGARDENRT